MQDRRAVQPRGPFEGMPRAVSTACAAVMLALAGCESYTATVQNASAITVIAELVREPIHARPSTAQSVVLRPGDRAELGPVEIEILDPVTLNVRRSGDPHAVPISRRLERSHSTWIVENGGLQTWDGFSLRLVDEPGGENAE